jgi:hypothetical protein
MASPALIWTSRTYFITVICAIWDSLLVECSYEILVDDSGRPAIPVEMDEN